MVQERRIYGEVENKSDMKQVFAAIRDDVKAARSRDDLTELYRRAGYLITLTHSPSWREKFGVEAGDLRALGEKEFATTARAINRRAKAVGTEPDYDETWGG